MQMKVGIALGLTIVGVIIGGLVIKNLDSGSNPLIGSNLKSQIRLPVPTPTPIPFYELTIPYLKSREYQSKLGEQALLSENSNYTSYLTSFISDGLKINGLLTKPKGDPPVGGWPGIVFVHGYIPPMQYRTTEKYVDYVDYLARSGFVVFKIDLRGHGSSEGDPGGGYYSSDYVIDTLNAYAALESSDFVNKGHIGVWGHSMAGNIILRALVAKPTIPVAVIWAGAGFTYSDLVEFRISDNSYQPLPTSAPSVSKQQKLFETYGRFDPNSEFWKTVTPINYLEGVKAAIQLDQALDDTVVSPKYAENLNKILDSTTIPHQLNEFPSGGHNITGTSFNSAMGKSVEFFKKYLGT